MKNFLQNRWVWFTVRLLLGVLFIVTGIGKIIDLEGFINIVYGYRLLPPGLALLAGSVLPFVELYIGCALVLGVFVRLTSVAIIPLSVTFGIGGIYALVADAGGIICGCFGTLIQISHPVSLTIDGIMLLLSPVLIAQKGKDFLTLGQVFGRIKPDFRTKSRQWFNVSLVASVLLVMAVITGITFAVK